MSKLIFGTGQGKFVGRSIVYPFPIPLEASQHAGAVIIVEDGQLYYSDGADWIIPTTDVEISRPSAQVPTNSVEQTQLRLSAFRSPAGLEQTGIIFEISTNGTDFVGADTKIVESGIASSYQLLYPEDGFVPGDEIIWRGKYVGTDGVQSEFSLPFTQTFPQLVDDPVAITRDGQVSGVVQISDFFSAFDLQYVNTEFQFWNDGDDPDVDPPIAEVTTTLGSTVSLPEALPEGGVFLWRARYGYNASGVGTPTGQTQYTEPRAVFKGAGAMVLVYDPALALNRTIQLPLGLYGGVVNVTVDWGDGNEDTYTTAGVKTHTYAAGVTGLVTVVISGQLEQYGGSVNIQGLVRVDNIGFNLGLTSLRGMFRNCTQNTTVCSPAMPPQVTDCSEMFYSADPGFNVSALDMSNVQNFEQMFFYSLYNGPLEWDTSSATSMRRMFYGYRDYTKFNHPSIGNWDVSNVTNFEGMFIRNAVFNQDLSGWDTSSATNMAYMFGSDNRNAGIYVDVYSTGGLFQYGISNWNVSNVTNFSYMFGESDANFYGRYWNEDISGWDTSSATNMEGMFSGCNEFNVSLSSWDMSNVTSIENMFRYTTSFNSSLAGWDLSSVTNMYGAFFVSAFNGDVSGWTLPASISGLFYNAQQFNNSSILSWDVSTVTDMSDLFSNALGFNQPIGNWGSNTGNVTNMSGMFYRARAFNQPLENWDVSSVTTMSRMFTTSGVSYTMQFNQPLASWDVSSVTDMTEMFAALGTGSGGSSGRGTQSFDQDISGWNLNPTSVNLSGFMQANDSAAQQAFSTENYSKLLAGWANTIAAQNGPFNVAATFSFRTYDATDHFVGELYEDAVEGRAYLTNSNRLTVSSAGDPLADGDYLFSGITQLYENGNGWYFVKTGGVWELRDNSDVVQATQQDAGDLSAPQLVATWNGDLASATVLRTGAQWTITDGGQV